MTNYIDGKFLISNIKYLCPDTITKASHHAQNSQAFHSHQLKEIPITCLLLKLCLHSLISIFLMHVTCLQVNSFNNKCHPFPPEKFIHAVRSTSIKCYSVELFYSRRKTVQG